MKTIWKYILQPNETIRLPKDSEFLSVQSQRDEVCIWFLVDPDRVEVERTFKAYPTGEKIPDDPGKYLGTVQLFGGSLIFHIFEKID